MIVDNTFLGPLWQQPLAHGADLVLYSPTKYIGGHSDVIAGACLGAEERARAGRAGMRTFLGTMAGPRTGWLLMRSLETLKLRMTAQMKNARYVADFLARSSQGREGVLPRLPRRRTTRSTSSTGASARAPGSIISPSRCTAASAEALPRARRAEADQAGGEPGRHRDPGRAPGEHDPRGHPAASARRELGITPAMVRLSVGVEHPEDLIADLAQALDAV